MTTDEFKIVNKRDYLHVIFPPFQNRALYQQYINEVISYCHSAHCYRLVGDLRALTEKVAESEIFFLGSFLADLDSTEYMKFAILAREEIVDPDLFLEKVTQKRGLNLKVFTGDIKEALNWLLAE